MTKLRKQISDLFLRFPNSEFKVNSILKKLKIKENQRNSLKKALNDLVSEKILIRNKKYFRLGRMKSPENLTGEIDYGKDGRKILKHLSDKTGQSSFYVIKEAKSQKLSIGDKVEFRLEKKDGDDIAAVTRILTEKIKFVTGRFGNFHTYGIVYPDSKEIKQEILISAKDFKNAKDGDKVYAEILNPEELQTENPELRGRIKEVLGVSGERKSEEISIIRKYNLVKEFPPEIEKEADRIKAGTDLKNRIDLRDKNVFTIDPADAKDFDDAVSIEKTGTGEYIIGVHIADVSHYVTQDSVLDREALKRGTSVYLVKNVIPMLPERLSNDICSLRPEEDRFTFSVFIHLSKKYALKGFELKKSIIRSKRRFSYEEAQSIIDKKKGDFAEELLLMHKISKSITLKRLKAESLDFDSNEVKFEFNEKGEVKEIVLKKRLDTMRLIEEFMLLANKCATLYVKELSKQLKTTLPFIYRVHDIPNKDKMKDLSEFIKQFGYGINIEDKNSLRKLLELIEGKPEEYIINDLLIRSMAKAIYTMKNIGHYGLGFKDYTHFTSPIRRYPDLMVHRILNEYIYHPDRILTSAEHFRKALPDICKQSSIMEQNAEQAERESIKLKQAEYLNSRVGAEYDGIISGMMQYGMFVEIIDILIEGMIRFRDMEDDYYEYDERKHIATGRRRRKVFRAGQKVKIKVIRVNMETRKIDFALV